MRIQHIENNSAEFFATWRRQQTQPTTCPFYGLRSETKTTQGASNTINGFDFDADNAW